ncbi:hypothetical protein H0H93_006401 [Arthromyces matolae]|nr:hypothetical protein H0H93_006401 [Arthromyces matolae]
MATFVRHSMRYSSVLSVALALFGVGSFGLTSDTASPTQEQCSTANTADCLAANVCDVQSLSAHNEPVVHWQAMNVLDARNAEDQSDLTRRSQVFLSIDSEEVRALKKGLNEVGEKLYDAYLCIKAQVDHKYSMEYLMNCFLDVIEANERLCSCEKTVRAWAKPLKGDSRRRATSRHGPRIPPEVPSPPQYQYK